MTKWDFKVVMPIGGPEWVLIPEEGITTELKDKEKLVRLLKHIDKVFSSALLQLKSHINRVIATLGLSEKNVPYDLYQLLRNHSDVTRDIKMDTAIRLLFPVLNVEFTDVNLSTVLEELPFLAVCSLRDDYELMERLAALDVKELKKKINLC